MKIRTQRTLAAALVILTVVAWAAVAPRSLWAGADKGPQRVARAAAGVGLPAADRDFSKVQAGAAYTDGRLLVRFAASVTPAQRDQALAALGGTLVEQVALVPGLCIVALSPRQSVASALAAYNAVPGVLYAEPDYQRVASASAQPIQPADRIPNASSAAGFTIPNDPLFQRSVTLGGQPVPVSEQWGLLNQFALTSSTLFPPYQNFGLTPLAAYAAATSYPLVIADDGSTYTATLGRPQAGQTTVTQTTTMGADIRAPEAWAITTGTRTVVVAVVDTGIAVAPGDYIASDSSFPTDDFYDKTSHTANLWVNTGEIPGNFIDDDGNGFVDDYGGWDFAENDPKPEDTDGHGTHIAGIIGARANNGLGIAGVAWNVRLMPLRASTTATLAITNEISAIKYAVLMGADIINLSFGGPAKSQAEFDAIQAAGAVGITVVAAAGNDNSSNDRTPLFPANCPLKNVVSVLATDQFDHRASFSNYGATTVDLGAPGTDILSLDALNPGGFIRKSGTSMAAAMVSGAAALLLSQNASLSADNVRQALLWSAYQPPALAFPNGTYSPLVGTSRSDGRLDLYGALKNIVIQDVQENYFAPSVIEYQYALRSVAGDGITDFVQDVLGTTATLEAFEDGQSIPISAGEDSSLLKAAQKQFKSIIVLDYTGSMQREPIQLLAMENGAKAFIQSMEGKTSQTALFGLYEFHIEDRRPTFVTNGFSADAALLASQIDAINPGIGGFFGGTRVWDAAFDAVSEFASFSATQADEFRTVVVFTDGNDTSSQKTPSDVIALARQLRVHVYFIGHGSQLTPAIEVLLQQTAFKTGARYYNSGGIALAFERLARDVASFYVVRWATLKDPTKTTVPSFRVALTPADALCPRDRASEYVGSKFDVAEFQGDRRQGALRWQILEATSTTVRAVLRATYVPRDIDHFDFTFPVGINRADLVPLPAGGLCGDWTPDPVDPTPGGPVHIQSPGPALPFASFGPILTFTVSASGTPTAQERALELLTQIAVEDTYADGQTFTLETFALPGHGALTVTLEPPAAIAAGAQWRVVGTTIFLNSGDQVILTSGTYAVEFAPATGFTAPTTITGLVVQAGQVTATTGTYVALATLTVTLEPPAAIAAGAQWRVVGTTTFLNSGDQVELTPGTYAVEFAPATGFTAPTTITGLVVQAGQVTATTGTYVAIVTRAWTLLVYLDGDNQNEASGVANFAKLASVGSNDKVNVVAIIDRLTTTTRRGLVNAGDSLASNSWGDNLGELNMGDSQTLGGFVEWGMTKFPAQHTALVLWDSGNGWTLSAPAAAPNKSICADDTSNDFLTLKEIRTALETVQTDFGTTPEVIGMDASLMSMVETAYELRNVSQFLVASENRTFMPGWPYDQIVTTMESAPLATPQSIAGSMANAAFQFQVGLVAGGDGAATESVIDLTKMGAVGLALDSFATTLNAHWEHEHSLCIAAAATVVNAVDAAVLSELHGGSGSGSNGLAIYFPLTSAVVSPDYTSLELQLAADTQWDEFLANYTFQMAGSWVDQARLVTRSFTDPLGNPMPNVDLVDFCIRLSASQAATIVAKITFKNCTVTAGDAAKGRQLAVAGGTPASSVKIQRILAVPAGVTLVNGVGSGGPGVLYLESNGIAEVVASGSLGILSSDRVPLGDVSVTGTLGTLSTRGCHVDLAEAAAFRSVKMEDLTTSATTSVVGNGLPVPAGFKTATINLVGVSAGQIWLPGQQLTVRAASKRNLDETGVSSVRQANIFNVYGGDVVSVTATGGNVVNSVVARGVLKNVSARGLIVTLSRIRFLFGGFLGVDGNETTTTLTAGGGDAAWMALHPTPGTRPPTVIGSLNGFRGVVVRAVAGYSADTTGGTLVIEPNFTGALQKIGTATFNGTGALTLGIQGNAFISQDAGEIHLSGDKAAVTSGRLVVHRAP